MSTELSVWNWRNSGHAAGLTKGGRGWDEILIRMSSDFRSEDITDLSQNGQVGFVMYVKETEHTNKKNEHTMQNR